MIRIVESMRGLILVPFALGLAACAATATPEPKSASTQADLPPSQDGVTRARLGQRVYVDGPYITPIAILEDSRCPAAEGVRCVWAGQVRLSVRVELGSGARVHEINTREPLHIADGNLQLVEVNPPRGLGTAAANSEYIFGFKFMGGL